MITSPLTPLLVVSLLSKEPSLLLLTAPRGAGKTTFCAEFAAQVRRMGLSVSGFICPAVFKQGKKIGIDMLNVATGERRRLGTRSQKKEGSTIGCWRLDTDVLNWGNQILIEVKDKDIIIIDELGPLELEDGYGFQEALCLLDDRRYRAALVVVRPALLALAKLRWPQAQVLDLERGGA